MHGRCEYYHHHHHFLTLVDGDKVGDFVGIAVGVAEGFDVDAVDSNVDKQLIIRERNSYGDF